ncbi:MAG: nucleotide sugar dehydrogenase, partial [Alphaproteobacteria bacterium]|nr:nucleotide sugar dehydrogenase [Alphaproteobacteria bacterium]
MNNSSLHRRISIIGLGYVGLPLAVAFGQKNDPVIAFDIDQNRLDDLAKGYDRTGEIDKDNLIKSKLHFTSNPQDLKLADFHIVTVPTPITNTRRPDLNALVKATSTIGKILKKGDIVVYESTVYPGATE